MLHYVRLRQVFTIWWNGSEFWNSRRSERSYSLSKRGNALWCKMEYSPHQRHGVVMKKLLILSVLLLTGCVYVPREKTFQVDYIQGGETKHIFLDVVEIEKDVYKVKTQEYLDEEPDFLIVDFFDYDKLWNTLPNQNFL